MLGQNRFLALISAVVLIPLLALQPASAQVDRGGIVGTVTDAGGARVVGAVVTITNLSANQSTKVTTDDTGNFSANLLRIGSYSVLTEKEGFQKTVESNVEVGVNQVVRVDVTLRVGSAMETVQVSSTVPLLQTEESSLAARGGTAARSWARTSAAATQEC